MFCLSFLLVTATVANPVFVFNEDDSHFFGRSADKMTEAGLLEYLDEVTASGAVTHFFMCPNAMRANFDSKAFEPVWTAMSEPGRKPGWGPRVKLLHDRGIDPYAVWAKGCRARGVSPWRWQAGRLSSAREARRLEYGCCAPFHP